MKIVVIGSGTMGMMLGTLLAINNEVTFVDAYKESMEYVKEHGVNLLLNGNTIHKDNIKTYYDSKQINETFDLAIIMVKTCFNKEVMNEYKHLFSDNTYVASFQNGIGNAEVFSEYIDTNHIIIGSLNITGKTVSLGSIECAAINKDKAIIIGEYINNFECQNVCNKLIESINMNNIVKAIYTDSMNSVIWSKALLNCCLNPLGAILNQTGDVLCKNENTLSIMKKVASEVESVAKACDIENVLAESINIPIQNIAKGPSNYPSMVADVKNKRKTEIDQLNGAIYEIGKSRGIDCPACELLTKLIHSIEDNY